jgi:hypothetical protein
MSSVASELNGRDRRRKVCCVNVNIYTYTHIYIYIRTVIISGMIKSRFRRYVAGITYGGDEKLV